MTEKYKDKSRQGYPVIYRGLRAPVLFRQSPHQPYVVASGYDAATGEWAQGTYLDDLKEAMAEADGAPESEVRAGDEGRLDADADLDYVEYWKCQWPPDCESCPSKIDGRRPRDYYGTGNCTGAQAVEIMRRRKALGRHLAAD